MFVLRLVTGWLSALAAVFCLGGLFLRPTGHAQSAYPLLGAVGVFVSVLLVRSYREAVQHWRLAQDTEKLKAQIAQICLAIEGCIAPSQLVLPHRPDWSCTYDKAVKLRQDYERLRLPAQVPERVEGLNTLSESQSCSALRTPGSCGTAG